MIRVITTIGCALSALSGGRKKNLQEKTKATTADKRNFLVFNSYHLLWVFYMFSFYLLTKVNIQIMLFLYENFMVAIIIWFAVLIIISYVSVRTLWLRSFYLLPAPFCWLFRLYHFLWTTFEISHDKDVVEISLKQTVSKYQGRNQRGCKRSTYHWGGGAQI